MLFPYFGAKSKAAGVVWQHLGDPDIYVEPFAGSLAVLLARPTSARVEVAVDLDGLLVNFWRSIMYQWSDVETYLTGSVAEIDIRAKHEALLDAREIVTAKLATDPHWCNPMLAAWWWEGISSWLGSGFGHRSARQRPHIDRSLKGLWSKGMTDEKIAGVIARLANVILLSGDWQDAWKRGITPAIVKRWEKGTMGVFLDPPYVKGERADGLYAEDEPLNKEITEWCLTQPRHVKIVVAGYDDEYPELWAAGWEIVTWAAPNGYAQEGNKRRRNEVLYVSRHRRLIRRAET